MTDATRCRHDLHEDAIDRLCRHFQYGLTERELLIEAVARDGREEFYRQMEQAQTPELRRRLLAITHAMENLGGHSR